jgi:hypothetical protein
VEGAASTVLEPQMDIPGEGRIETVNKSQKYQNVVFSDQTDPYMYAVDSPMDPTRMLQDTHDATLENFFLRPVKIVSSDWAVSNNFYEKFDPWSLYLENPRVANRIANYNLFRAKLRLKVVINGNSFLYGRAIASYLPLAFYDEQSSANALIEADLVQMSQQPHVYINPTTSTGGELSLPFFYHQNYVNISLGEYRQLGNVTIKSMTTLKHANGAGERITVSVFAWLEDVSLNGLTSVEVGTLIPQMGTEIDEANKTGMISGPATAVAKLAGLGKMIPVIAPFATATERAANITAKLAKSLGYSRPPITAAPMPYKPTPITSMALTTVPDGVQKLSLDDKQELSIDPRIAGIGPEDPMIISTIAQRESWISSFQWRTGVVSNSVLYNIRVDPCVWAQSGDPATRAYHLPACAVAALPFKYWTGTMKYRFQVVCSAFHRGRLKIVFDPNFLASNEYNVNYIEIVDLAEKQDFTIEVSNAQEKTLLDHALPGTDSITELLSVSQYASRGKGNGVIGVYVENELTTPNSVANNDVQVNVFVSAGADFEVFVPDDAYQVYEAKSFVQGAPAAKIEPQMGGVDVVETTEASPPVQTESTMLGPDEHDNDLINRVYTGESVASFRTLLKRYNLHTAVGGSSNNSEVVRGTRCMFPYLRGNMPDAVDTTVSGSKFNYANTLLLHWITMPHSGWRGGIRWKFLPRSQLTSTSIQYNVALSNGRGGQFRRDNDTILANGSPSRIASETMRENINFPLSVSPFSGVMGMMYQTSETNPTVEFEVPFYSYERFSPGKRIGYTSNLPDRIQGFDYHIYMRTGSSTRIDMYCAAAEDFQVYFWTGMPRLYKNIVPDSN